MNDERNFLDATRKAINLIGGMKTVVKAGDKVVVKPNFFGPRPASEGATTNLAILQEILEEVIECGTRPILAEGPFRFYNADFVFKKLGVKEMAHSLGIDFINLNEAESIEVDIPNGKALKKIRIPQIVLEADILINVPKMKTHHLTTVTLGMKNLKGVLPGDEKQKSHVYGIHQSIVDINKLVRSSLIVVDGTVSMEGSGPTFGDPVKLGIVVAGKNVVAVDTICCRIMGIEPKEVEHIRLAYEDGLCSGDIESLGEPLAAVQRKFEFPRESKTYLFFHDAVEKLDHTLYDLSGKRIFPFLSAWIGKRPRIDRKVCIKCGICEKACIVTPPAINFHIGKIDYQCCIDCLLCMEQCPVNAIKVRSPLWGL